MEKKQIIEIDFTRAICCTLVIIIHVTGAFWNSFINNSLQHIFIILLNALSRFVVPCFIFINGFVMYTNYNKKVIAYGQYIKKRVKKIIIPYIIWSLIYLILNFYFVTKTQLSMKEVIGFLLLGSSSYHMYFIVLIIQFYIMFPIIKRLYNRINNNFLAFILALGISLITDKVLKLKYNDRFFLYYFVFYILGFIIANVRAKGVKYKNIYKFSYLVIYIMVAFVFCIEYIRAYTGRERLISNSYQYIWWVYCLFSIVFMAFISKMYTIKIQSLRIKSIVNSLSKNSFSIYLCHPLLMTLLGRFKYFKLLKSYSMSIAFITELFIIFFSSWFLASIFNVIKSKKLYIEGKITLSH